jgi:hypothetical protein
MCAMPVPFYWFTLRDPQTYRFKSVRIADGYATSSANVHERRRSQGVNRGNFPPEFHQWSCLPTSSGFQKELIARHPDALNNCPARLRLFFRLIATAPRKTPEDRLMKYTLF